MAASAMPAKNQRKYQTASSATITYGAIAAPALKGGSGVIIGGSISMAGEDQRQRRGMAWRRQNIVKKRRRRQLASRAAAQHGIRRRAKNCGGIIFAQQMPRIWPSAAIRKAASASRIAACKRRQRRAAVKWRIAWNAARIAHRPPGSPRRCIVACSGAAPSFFAPRKFVISISGALPRFGGNAQSNRAHEGRVSQHQLGGGHRAALRASAAHQRIAIAYSRRSHRIRQTRRRGIAHRVPAALAAAQARRRVSRRNNDGTWRIAVRR